MNGPGKAVQDGKEAQDGKAEAEDQTWLMVALKAELN